MITMDATTEGRYEAITEHISVIKVS